MRSLIPFLVVSTLIASCSCNCPAQQGAAPFDPTKKVTGHDDAVGNQTYRRGQAIDLPPGLQLTVAIPKNYGSDPLANRVGQWFTAAGKNQRGQFVSANPRLRQIQESCAWHYVFTDDPNWAETARAQLLGNGLTVMLTGPDGMIKRDGSGGLLMGAAELATIKNADEMADHLLDGAEGFKPKLDLLGMVQQTFTPTKAVPAGYCEKCNTYTAGGPCPNCTPSLPQPDSGTIPPRLPSVRPNPSRNQDSARAILIGIAGGVVVLSMAAVGAALHFRQKNQPT